MGRGEKLHPTETHAILKLNKERYPVTKIAETVNRSRKVTINLLKDSDNCGKSKNRGRSQCLTVRDKRAPSDSSSTRETNCRKSWIYDKCWKCSTSFEEL